MEIHSQVDTWKFSSIKAEMFTSPIIASPQNPDEPGTLYAKILKKEKANRRVAKTMRNHVGYCRGNDESCHQASSILMKPLTGQADDPCSPDIDSSIVAVEPNPLPQRQIFLIWLIHASQGFQTTMLFPMLVFMVEKYGVTGVGGRAIGWRAGLLASLFPLAQFCTSMIWGIVSDKTGRRPWLGLGCSVSAISALLLGVCSTYKGACYLRFFGGLLNGTLTVTKSALAELCDRTNQAKGFGILNLAWGIGSIAGPIVSGFLAQPCLQYKMNNCPQILEKHPFLLPCIGATIFSTAGIVASFFFKETNLRFQKTSSSYNRISDMPQNEIYQQESERSSDNPKEVDLTSQSCKPKLIVVIAAAEDQSAAQPWRVSEAYPAGSTRNSSSKDAGHYGSKRSRFEWIDRDVLMASLCYSMTGLIFIVTDELFPIYGAASKAEGGLGLSASSLGLILGEGGVVLCVYTLVLYPRVAVRLGPLKSFRMGILSTIPLWICFPVSSLLDRAPLLQWCLLLTCMAIRSMSACTTFTGVLILVSNSASSENMGAVTGLSHSLCSFFRAVGPAVGGLVWSYASGKRFFLHQFMAWIFVVVLSSFTYVLAFYLPPTLSQPKCLPLSINKSIHYHARSRVEEKL